MKSSLVFSLHTLFAGLILSASAADQVFSGPQPGESTTPFKVIELTGPNDGNERDPIADHAGAPTALVFIHALERSLVPLLRVVDQYGGLRKDRIKTEVVFLFADRIEGERRGRAAAQSLRLQSHVGLSLDGLEGPGNYGLNKECMMTIVAAKNNQVTANFALVQPGIADAAKVIEALARVCGDPEPPSVEELSNRPRDRAVTGRERQERMRGEVMRRGRTAPVDFSKFDLNAEAGLRDAVRALMKEVEGLRNELNELRTQEDQPDKEGRADRPAPRGQRE